MALSDMMDGWGRSVEDGRMVIDTTEETTEIIGRVLFGKPVSDDDWHKLITRLSVRNSIKLREFQLRLQLTAATAGPNLAEFTE